MKQEFYFHIPQPCHEDWNKMNPAAKGRFCESCSKQVVDFSLMSDNEVLNYFSKNTGKVCGRFADDQLQRPMHAIKQEKKKAWWIVVMMPLLLLIDKASAQKKNVKPIKSLPEVVVTAQRQEIMGKVMVPTIVPEKLMSVSGKIINEKGIPIPFASVYVKENSSFVSADSTGNFQLQIISTKNSFTIKASAVGYEPTEKQIDEQEFDHLTITLKQKEILLPNVTVTAQNLSGRLGGLVAVCVVRRSYLVDTVRKIFRNEVFKTFPNPITKGNIVHLELKKAGEYSIQLLDNNSKLILVEDFIAVGDGAIANINIPSSLGAGIYYIRVIDEKKKKQYTDKIIVQ